MSAVDLEHVLYLPRVYIHFRIRAEQPSSRAAEAVP